MSEGSTACQRPPCSPIDDLRDRLKRAGWRLDETCHGTLWQVDGSKGENRMLVTGPTQAQAWWNACVVAACCPGSCLLLVTSGGPDAAP
jgi:hypothetical protein